MSAAELLVRVLAQVQPLLPYMLIVTAVTTAALAALLFASRGLWVDQRRFRWLGLFFGLSTWDSIRLAGAWVKLLLLFTYLVLFKRLGMAEYLLFLASGVAYTLSRNHWIRIPGRIMWNVLEATALVSCNLLCGYVHEVSVFSKYLLVYCLMAVFSALFGVYLFFTELNDISAGRQINLGNEWEKVTEEE